MLTTALCWITARIIKIIYLTCRYQYHGTEKIKQYVHKGKPMIVIFWHSRSMMMSKMWYTKVGNYPVNGIISMHRDGQYISKILGFLGVGTIEGSTTRGGLSALRNVLRDLKKGISVAITPDGPKGPRQRLVTEGLLYMAKTANVPIIPIGVSATHAKRLPTWDRYMVVLPFSKIFFEIADPVFIPKKASISEIEKTKKSLEKTLNDLTCKLDTKTNLPLADPE